MKSTKSDWAEDLAVAIIELTDDNCQIPTSTLTRLPQADIIKLLDVIEESRKIKAQYLALLGTSK